jgi:PAS domain S-box-containing protein
MDVIISDDAPAFHGAKTAVSNRSGLPVSELSIPRLQYELLIHQKALEIQSDDLAGARTAAEMASARLADFFESSPLGNLVLLRDGTVKGANPIASDLLGSGDRAPTGLPLQCLIPESELPEFHRFLSQIFEGSKVQSAAFSIVRERHPPRVVQIHAMPSHDRSECWTVITDVTTQARLINQIEALTAELETARSGIRTLIARQQHADAIQRENETHLRLIVESSGIGLWDWDLQSQTVYLSPEWKRQIGYDDAEIPNTLETCRDRVHPEDLPRIEATVARYLESPWPNYQSEYRVRHKDGSYRWILGRGTLIRDDQGRPVRMIGGHVDITERKRNEEILCGLSARILKVQDEERRRVARDLHDTTSQSLASLAFTFQRIRENVPNPDANLQRWMTDCASLIDLISQEIRTTSYLLHPPMLEALGLARAIEEYVAGFSVRCGIPVEVQVAECGAHLDAEANLALFRVLQEALTNVYRHSESSTASVKLALENSSVCLEISDSGRGISSPLGDRGIPLGIGIAGMRERLHQLGGGLGIENSTPGTRVIATLPRENPPSGE